MVVRQVFLLLGIAYCLASDSGWADRIGPWQFDRYSQGLVITFYHGTFENTVQVPEVFEEIPGVPVQGIAETFNGSDVKFITLPPSLLELSPLAFFECNLLSEIQIPAKIRSVGGSAFAGCTNLKTVALLGNASLERSAFENCGSLKSVFFSYSGTNPISWASGIFSGCAKLSQITIPVQVPSLPTSLFNGCSSLTNVEARGALQRIDIDAFRSCTSLTNLVFSNAVDTVVGVYGPDYDGAFQASGITNLVFEKRVRSIGDAAFSKMPNLQSISFHEEIGSIPQVAFYDCPRLTTIEVGGGVQSLGSRAFEKCPSLTNINFYGGLKSIETEALADAKQLKTLILPPDLTNISTKAFLNCSGLEKLIFMGTNPPKVVNRSVFSGCRANVKIYYPKGAASWSQYNQWWGFEAIPYSTNIEVAWPTVEPMQSGQKLSEAILTGGSARDAETGEKVSGTFSFEDPSFQPPGGDFATNLVFIPTLWYLGEQTRSVAFRVWTNIPVIQVPENLTAPVGWRFSYRIQASNNPSSFVALTEPSADVFRNFYLSPESGEISGIPQKTGKVSFRVSAQNPDVPAGQADLLLQVTRGTPRVVRPPMTSAIRAGQPLSRSVLSGGSASNDLGTVLGKFSWLIPDRRPLAGTTSQDVRFTPSDLVNYRPTIVSVPVQVLGITSPATLVTLTNGMAPAESLDIKVNFPAIRYEAFGLPPGLKLDAKTGQITGRPTIPNGSTLASYPTTLVAWRSQTESYSLQKTLVVAPRNALAYLDQFLSMLRPLDRQP